MRPTVKVMADYAAFPLWLDGEGGPVNMRTERRPPISQKLVDRLLAWASEYERHALSTRWPDLVVEWNASGHRLATEMAAELGSAWRVVYFDEVSGEDIEVTQERSATRAWGSPLPPDGGWAPSPATCAEQQA